MSRGEPPCDTSRHRAEQAATAQRASASDAAARLAALVPPLVAVHHDAALVIGVTGPEGDAFYAFGKVSALHPQAPDAATRFEIGSVSKLFVGMLFADMVVRGEVALEDPAQRYLPASLVLPTHAGRAISLVDLATHTSGLNQLPWNNPAMRRARGEQVSEQESIGHPSGTTYGMPQLASALTKEKLDRPPGSGYRYSSLGIGLLGIALSGAADRPLAELVRARITGPLDMTDTHYFHEVTEFDATFAQGYDERGQPRFMRKDEEAIAGCCSIRSSARDLLKLMRAQFEPGPLEEAAHLTQLPLRAGGNTYLERIGLPWHLLRRPQGRMYKLGQMNGYRAFVEVDRPGRRAVVVLAAHHAFPVEQVARALLPRPEPEFTVHTELARNADARAPRARWDAGISLLELSAPPQLAPGDELTLRWTLRAEGPITRELRFFLHADGIGGRLKDDRLPDPPITRWPAGSVVEHTLRFAVPADYPAGELCLWFGFFDDRGRSRVLAGATDGEDRVRGPCLKVR